MNAVPFDTLKMAQRLEAAGFSAPQAAGAAEALAEALGGAGLATKGDIESLRVEYKSDNQALRNDNQALRTETQTGFELLRREMELLRRDMTIRLGGMLIVGFGVMTAVLRLLPMHP